MPIKNKKGRVDYRAWANKYLKPGSMPPPPIRGFGVGRKRFCPKCNILAGGVTYKSSICYCNTCGTIIKEYLPDDYKFLYSVKPKTPLWIWNLLDKICLYRERRYSDWKK